MLFFRNNLLSETFFKYLQVVQTKNIRINNVKTLFVFLERIFEGILEESSGVIPGDTVRTVSD